MTQPSTISGKAFVDFQNDVTAKDLAIAAQEGFRSIEHVKRYTTTGMATDQGKTANMNALALVARLTDRALPQVGHTTFRSPYTPVTFGAFAGAARGELFEPVRRTPIHDWAAMHGAVFESVGTWQRAHWFPRDSEDMRSAVARECRTVRNTVGMFDATTLGKIEVVGPDAAEFLDRIYTGEFSRLAPGRCRYGVLLNEAGFCDGRRCRGALGAQIASTSPRRPVVPPACCIIWKTTGRRNSQNFGFGSRPLPSNGQSSPCRVRLARADDRAAGPGHRYCAGGDAAYERA